MFEERPKIDPNRSQFFTFLNRLIPLLMNSLLQYCNLVDDIEENLENKEREDVIVQSL